MVADWSCGNMHVKSRELENNGVYKEALPAKMLNLVLSLFDLFHSFKFCLCPAEKKKKKSSSVVLGRCLANTLVHMQWKELTETNICCNKPLPVGQQWYMEENQKWKLLWKVVTDFKCVTGSEKEFEDYLFVILKK